MATACLIRPSGMQLSASSTASRVAPRHTFHYHRASSTPNISFASEQRVDFESKTGNLILRQTRATLFLSESEERIAETWIAASKIRRAGRRTVDVLPNSNNTWWNTLRNIEQGILTVSSCEAGSAHEN